MHLSALPSRTELERRASTDLRTFRRDRRGRAYPCGWNVANPHFRVLAISGRIRRADRGVVVAWAVTK